MVNEVATVSRKRFFVFLVGKTNGAHLELVTKLKGFGQIEVKSFGESDYLLVFCPIVSRVGTDISEALDKLPGGKATILVVLHHTFNRDHVVAESRRLVNNMNVRLTVDCLFYDGRLLTCRRNDTAWSDIQKFLLEVSPSQVSIRTRFRNWCLQNWKTGFVLALVGLARLVIWKRKQAFTYYSLLFQPVFWDCNYVFFIFLGEFFLI